MGVAPRLSVVIPMLDEQQVLPELARRLRPVLDSLEMPYEVVAVDDGSTDATPRVLVEIGGEWPQLRRIRLQRRAGHQAATMAGLSRARGQWVVTMDADLQDPPELLPRMLAAANEGSCDVVYAVRGDRSADSWLKRTTAAGFYRLMRRLAGPQVQQHAGDFRLMSRRVVDQVLQLPSEGQVLRLAVPWFGFASTTVEYTREPRAAGESKYSYPRMLRLAFDGITSFSAAPLRIATWLGFVGFVVCFVLVVLLVLAGIYGRTVPGWTSTLLIVASLGAVQLLSLGLLGEYVGRLFDSAQRRPAYLVAEDSADDGVAG